MVIAEKRLSIAEIAEQLGDKTSTVLDTYTHVLNEWRGAGPGRHRGRDPRCRRPRRHRPVSGRRARCMTPLRSAAVSTGCLHACRNDYGELLAAFKDMADRAAELGHEPTLVVRHRSEMLISCDRCPALGYADAEDHVIGGSVLEAGCPNEEERQETTVASALSARCSCL